MNLRVGVKIVDTLDIAHHQQVLRGLVREVAERLRHGVAGSHRPNVVAVLYVLPREVGLHCAVV